MNYCKDCRYFVQRDMYDPQFRATCCSEELSPVVDDPVFGPQRKFTPCRDIREFGVGCTYFEEKPHIVVWCGCIEKGGHCEAQQTTQP